MKYIKSNKVWENFNVLKAAKERLDAKESSFTDPRDGKTYKTIVLGGVEWFKENLNYDLDKDLENITLDTFNIEKQSVPAEGGECGFFYTFQGAQDACPDGWEIPLRSDFTKLFTGITLKHPHQWSIYERRIIHQTLVGSDSLLDIKFCGFYGKYEWSVLKKGRSTMEVGESGSFITSTPGSLGNGGAVFRFYEDDFDQEPTYAESVGYDFYSVRPIRKNI